MDPLETDCSWQDFLRDCDFIDETTPSNFVWSNNNHSAGGDFSAVDINFSSTTSVAPDDKESTRKRGRSDSSIRPGSKACRERLRREKLNDRFMDLSSVLEPGRPAKTDKPAILDDAIRVLNQLKSEAQELKHANQRLLEEIKNLKAEKNELREEKLVLKEDKERMEQQLKAVAVAPSGFMPAHQAAYHSGANKMTVFSSYGMIPMWQYLPSAACDTSRDHELRPPAA